MIVSVAAFNRLALYCVYWAQPQGEIGNLALGASRGTANVG
jgi:hypothetical protein